MSSCQGKQEAVVEEGIGEFAIYLIKLPPPDSRDSIPIELEENPIIATKDIISYDRKTHTIKLTQAAFRRICDLKVYVAGRPFVVIVGSKRLYRGAFWTPVSSFSFDGVVMKQPWSDKEKKRPIIKIELGYPTEKFFKGDDPRNNVDIMRALEASGKLR